MKNRQNSFQRHWLELSLAVIGILLTAGSTFFGVPESVAWTVGISTALIAFSVAIVKEHVSAVGDDVVTSLTDDLDPSTRISAILASLDGELLTQGRNQLSETISRLEQLEKGIIHLDEPSYFDEAQRCMRAAEKGTEVYAINSIDSLRWSEDPRQRRYWAENQEATKRGALIHRIFVISRHSVINEFDSPRIKNICDQVSHPSLKTSVVWREELEKFGLIEDWVYFSKPRQRLLIDFVDQADRTRVSHAHLILNSQELERRLHDFERLLNYAAHDDDLRTAFPGIEPK